MIVIESCEYEPNLLILLIINIYIYFLFRMYFYILDN